MKYSTDVKLSADGVVGSGQTRPADRVEKVHKGIWIRQGVGGYDVGGVRSEENTPDRDLDLLAVKGVGKSTDLDDPVRHVPRRELQPDCGRDRRRGRPARPRLG